MQIFNLIILSLISYEGMNLVTRVINTKALSLGWRVEVIANQGVLEVLTQAVKWHQIMLL